MGHTVYNAPLAGENRPAEGDHEIHSGVFVGAALMLGSAYLHDTGMVRAGPKQPFVNWDTVIGMWGR
jgi:hypothetical protein